MRLAYPGTKPIVTAWLTDFGSLVSIQFFYYALPRVTLSLVVANKKGTDQPVHLRSLISAYWKVSYVDELQEKFNFLASL